MIGWEYMPNLGLDFFWQFEVEETVNPTTQTRHEFLFWSSSQPAINGLGKKGARNTWDLKNNTSCFTFYFYFRLKTALDVCCSVAHNMFLGLNSGLSFRRLGQQWYHWRKGQMIKTTNARYISIDCTFVAKPFPRFYAFSGLLVARPCLHFPQQISAFTFDFSPPPKSRWFQR